jgi:hypothetical protein
MSTTHNYIQKGIQTLFNIPIDRIARLEEMGLQCLSTPEKRWCCELAAFRDELDTTIFLSTIGTMVWFLETCIQKNSIESLHKYQFLASQDRATGSDWLPMSRFADYEIKSRSAFMIAYSLKISLDTAMFQ